MQGADVREDLARACRVLAHHELIDLWGHVSVRVPGSDLMVTPRFGRRCVPRAITARDILVTSLSGTLLDGSGELPRQFAADVEVYRRRPEAGAVMFASPSTAMAAAIARYRLAPLTHMESSIAYDLAFFEHDTLAEPESSAASQLAQLLLDSGAVQQPGIGAWTTGKDLLDALTKMYHLEYLAQANLVSALWQEAPDTVQRSDSDKLWSQFSGHHHYAEFFRSLDPGALPHPYDAFLANYAADGDPANILSAAIAFSCRALWERDTLVAFLEHISHRLPGDTQFVMTAAKNFRDMTPGDLCVLDYDANWIGGPRPPGFKWFHAQLLSERRDAQAVVHTHDLLGRVYALGKRKLVPAFRTGLEIAMAPLPAYPRCDLIVDADVRRQTIDALGTGPVVHEIGHGTDFVSATLERSTVDAIQREAFLRMHHLAERFGTPHPLPERLRSRLKEVEPDAVDWWWFYTAEVGAPKRSAGGL